MDTHPHVPLRRRYRHPTPTHDATELPIHRDVRNRCCPCGSLQLFCTSRPVACEPLDYVPCVPPRPPFDPCHFLRSDPHIRGPRVLENLHDCVVPAFTGAVWGSHHPLALGHDDFFACDHSGDNSTGLDDVVCVRPSTASMTLTKVSRLLAENQVRGGDVVRDTVARDLARNCFDRFSNDRVLDLSSPASFVEYQSGRCGVVLQTAFKHLPQRRLHSPGDIITQQFQNLLT